MILYRSTLAAIAMLLTACVPSQSLNSRQFTQSITPTMVSALCHSINGRADHTCSPGLFSHTPEVLADASNGYRNTLCQHLPPGSHEETWTQKRRPPTSSTNKWKLQVMTAYGFRNIAMDDVEGDHVGPLTLDGDPGYAKGSNGLPLNFYPQFWDRPVLGSAKDKDREENLLHRQVCSGGLTLKQAQEKIIRDWTK